MIQSILVVILFLLASAFLLRLGYQAFFGAKKGCDNCPMAKSSQFNL